MQYNAMQYNTMQYNTIQYNTTQHNTIQYNTIQSDSEHCGLGRYDSYRLRADVEDLRALRGAAGGLGSVKIIAEVKCKPIWLRM